MGNLGFWEILMLGVLALLIFGPDRLPGMARNAGKMVAAFKREADSTLAELREAAEFDESLREVRDLRREFAGIGKELADTGRSVTEQAAPPQAAEAGAPFDPDAT